MLEKNSDTDSELRDNLDLAKKLCGLRFKEVLRETLSEYQRRGNFVRIYPAKGSDVYDIYFQ